MLTQTVLPKFMIHYVNDACLSGRHESGPQLLGAYCVAILSVLD